MYKIGAAGHPCLAERDIAKIFDMKPFDGFISKIFAISRSARQGCPAAPILYIIQAEPMACAIRNTPEIQCLYCTREKHLKSLYYLKSMIC
jgi:hypothetical protein